MPKVALVRCLELPEPDADAEITLDTLRHLGIDAEWVAWDDQKIDWASFDLTILRSCWNYYERPQEFEGWLRGVANRSRLFNPLEIVVQNLEKSYLASLRDVGIPIVPTRFVQQSEPIGIDEFLSQVGWEQFVIKPTISAGSYLTEKFHRDERERAGEFLALGLKNGNVLIQEYMSSVSSVGEANFIHIDGELTHGIIKTPRFRDDCEKVSDPIQPSESQRDLCQKIMATIPTPTLYARVDLMLGPNGWMLSELELIEPSLFFIQFPPAADRFAEAIKKLLL